MDSIDKQILMLLQVNARITIKEISEKLGLTKTPIFERIKKLERKGIISSYNTILDNRKIDKGLIVYINVLLNNHTKLTIDEFKQKIALYDEVLECYYISGNADFLLKVYCKDMDDYRKFIETKFSVLNQVNQFYSSFVLEESKNERIFVLK